MAEYYDFPNGECYLISHFKESDAYSYRNSIVRQITILERNFCGREVAFCQKMQPIETNTENKFGIGIIHFPDFQIAKNWYESSHEIRQPDWLNNVTLILVPARNDVDFTMPIVEFAEWNFFRDVQKFQNEYLSHLNTADKGQNNIIAAPEYTYVKLRGNWCPKYLAVTQWASINALQNYADERGPMMLEILNSVAGGNIWAGVNSKSK